MPRKLLVASGKGGVGTSVAAALLALMAAERDERVLLVDASEAGGSQHHLFGVCPARSLWMLSDPNSQPDTTPIAIDDNFSLVAGGTSGAATAPTSDADRRSALTRLAQLYSSYDTIIIDGGSRLDTISAVADLADPSLLLVTSADRLALAANYALVKSVRARRAGTAISVLTNRHGDAVSEEACDFLVGACSHFLGRGVDVAGAIPDDPCLQAAIGAGMTVGDALHGSPAADAMRGVLNRLLPSRSTAPRPATMSIPSSFTRRWS
jgi:flagellar biosynthesis protein FlhG